MCKAKKREAIELWAIISYIHVKFYSKGRLSSLRPHPPQNLILILQVNVCKMMKIPYLYLLISLYRFFLAKEGFLFNPPTQRNVSIWCVWWWKFHTLDPHLEHTHAVCISEYLVSFRVVAVSYVGCSDEELKRIVLADIDATTLQLLLQLTHALLAMAVRSSDQCTMPLHTLSVLIHLLNPSSFL